MKKPLSGCSSMETRHAHVINHDFHGVQCPVSAPGAFFLFHFPFISVHWNCAFNRWCAVVVQGWASATEQNHFFFLLIADVVDTFPVTFSWSRAILYSNFSASTLYSDGCCVRDTISWIACEWQPSDRIERTTSSDGTCELCAPKHKFLCSVLTINLWFHCHISGPVVRISQSNLDILTIRVCCVVDVTLRPKVKCETKLSEVVFASHINRDQFKTRKVS